MKKYQLIYFEGCPNAKHARAVLLTSGVPFDEIIQDNLEKGDDFKNYSSPSILKDGKLIFGQKLPPGSSACSFDKIDEQKLKEVLLNSKKEAPDKVKRGLLGCIGSFGSGLTVGLCPACIPAFGAFLSSIGLGFLVSESVFKSLLFFFLFIALSGFLWSYFKEHKNIYPLIIGSVMAAAIYVGRYIFIGTTINLILMYGGIAGIIGVSIWNWRLRTQKGCMSCYTDQNL